MLIKRLFTIASLALLLISLATLPPLAQAAYPEKEIRFIVPYAAGGLNDIVARKISDIVGQEKLLPVPIIVTNIHGAQSRNGLNAVKSAAADGYTILLHHTGIVANNALGQIPNSYKDYHMIGQLLVSPCALDVKADAKWKTIQDLLADIKANPGKLRIGVAIGSVTHVAFMNFLNQNGLPVNSVKYIPLEGGGETYAALIGNKVDFTSVQAVSALANMRGGETRILIALTTENMPAFKGIANLGDLGIKKSFGTRLGLFAPAGTPDEAVKKLTSLLQTLVKSKAMQDFANDRSCVLEFIAPEEWGTVFDEDYSTVRTIAKEAGLIK